MVVRALQERYQQYKLVEAKLLQNRVRLQAKLPDIKKALDTVKLLVERRDGDGDGEPLTADFELSDGVFAKAKVSRAIDPHRPPSPACLRATLPANEPLARES